MYFKWTLWSQNILSLALLRATCLLVQKNETVAFDILFKLGTNSKT